MIILKTLILILLFLICHELGHIISAKIMGMKVTGIGIDKKPIPHIRISVKWPMNKIKRSLYLMSGFIFYILISIILFLLDVINPTVLALAVLIQFVIETNPIYSDFIILILSNKVYEKVKKDRTNFKTAYMQVYNNFIYNKLWYFYFITWTLIFFLLTKKLLL